MPKLNQCYGIGQALINVLPPPIAFENAPTSSQTNFAVGQEVYVPGPVATAFYKYMGDGIWVEFVTSTGDILSIIGTAPVTATTLVGVSTIALAGPPNVTTLTNHGVVVGQGTSAVAATAAGSAGQFLVSGGASADPLWSTATIPATAGATGTILRSNGTNWVATTDTYPNTVVAGDVLIATATNVIGSLADVATGQVLMSGGVGVAPAYSGSPSVSGSLTAATSITATAGNITATNGNIVRGTAGNKDIYTSVASTITAGANSAGKVTLVGGTATVSTTAITASSQVRLYRQGIGATGAAALGIITLGTISAGVSFIINAVQAADATALQASDVSSIGWEIVN
jgi:hypothetical protein